MSDIIIRATGERAPLRFVLISLKNVMNEIGAKHNAKNFALKFMAETSIASLLLSSTLKFPGTVSLKLDSTGDIQFVQADSTPQGLVRAMIPQKDLQKIGLKEPLITPHQLVVIKRNENGERIKESIVEAPSEQMGVNLTVYLHQSEQTKSAAGILAGVSEKSPSKLDFAIGFLLEAYPNAEVKDLEIMDAVIRSLPDLKSFYKNGEYKTQELLDILRGPYEIKIIKEIEPKAYCPCSHAKVIASLEKLPKSEIKDIKQENEVLNVVCEFCRTNYKISPSELFT